MNITQQHADKPDQFEQERIADARQDLSDLLPSVLTDLEHVTKRMVRAQGQACDCDPVTALYLSDLLETTEAIQWKLRLLVAARS